MKEGRHELKKDEGMKEGRVWKEDEGRKMKAGRVQGR